MKTRNACLLAGLVSMACGLPASAAVLAYDNTPAYSGTSLVTAGTASQGAVTVTGMIADDLVLDPAAAGQTISSFVFSIANFDADQVIARPRLRFYTDNAGQPGALLTAISYTPVGIPALTVQSFTLSVASLNIQVPANSRMWIGLMFDNSGSGAPAAQLAHMGAGLYGPPTVGSSSDNLIQFPAPASGSYLVSNPSGGTVVTQPRGLSLGYRISVAPEPASAGLLAAAAAASLSRRRRPSRK